MLAPGGITPARPQLGVENAEAIRRRKVLDNVWTLASRISDRAGAGDPTARRGLTRRGWSEEEKRISRSLGSCDATAD